jgi:hypothetical protein
MRPIDHASDLSPDQRLRELARIFAAAVVRKRRRKPISQQLETAGNSLAAGLEVSPDTVLSVTNPVNGRESPTLGEPA